MCENARNKCSVFVAMAMHGEQLEADEAFVRMVSGKTTKCRSSKNGNVGNAATAG